MIRHALAALLALTLTACAPSSGSQQTGPPGSGQVAGLVATNPSGPAPPPHLTVITLSVTGQAAPVGSTTTVSATVTDPSGNPVPGAAVSFAAVDSSRGPSGLGSAVTDSTGSASVPAGVTSYGLAYVTVRATTTYADSGPVIAAVIGQ